MDPVNELIRAYKCSSVRPYKAPAMYGVPIEQIIELVDLGYDLDLSNNYQILRSTIEDNNLELLSHITNLYPRDMRVTIALPDTSIDAIKILNDRFDYITTSISDVDSRNIDEVMDVIDKITILGDKVGIPINDDTSIIRQYVKILKLPTRLILGATYCDKYTDIDQAIVSADISSLSSESYRPLLTSAINQGYYGLAHSILDLANMDSLTIAVEGLTGLKCLLDLSKDYPDIIRSNYIAISVVITELINYDYYLQYCADPEFSKYIDMLDDDELLTITNPNVMRELRGRVPTCSKLIQSMKSDDSMINWVIIQSCKNVIPASDKITYEEGQYVTSLIGRYSVNDCDIIDLLIEMHLAKLIDIRDYKDDHKYIEFIVDRLPIDKSRLMKNARSSESR